ncbi:unnamed protein product, partial [Staurois parvus]
MIRIGQHCHIKMIWLVPEAPAQTRRRRVRVSQKPSDQGRTDHLETWALPEGPGS